MIVYDFTLFSAFLAPITNNVALVAALLTGTSFVATSVWAIFGTTIKIHLHNPQLKTIVNILLSLSLVYTAVSLIGLV